MEALYLALVDAPPLSVAELTALGVLTSDALLPALKALESHGLIHQLPGQSRRYSAVDPELGLVTLVAEQEQAASSARSAAHQLTEGFRAARRGQDPLDVIDVVVGLDSELRRCDELQRLASDELRGFDKPPYLSGAINQTVLERLGDGISVRVLYDKSALEAPGVPAQIRRYRDAGEQQRALDGVPLKMIIADEKLAVIRLTSESTGASSSLFVHPSVLLEGLSRVFETLWRFATPLHPDDAEPGTSAPGRCSPDESTILGLLAVGMTDEAIGRHLGTSVRTVRRQLRATMDRLGVRTRFQAALRAKERNWL